MEKRNKTMNLTFKHIDFDSIIDDLVDNFMNHLNNVMDKPDGYSYDLNTRGSKYYKVVMNTRGSHSDFNSRSVYCFINKRNGDILKPAGWRGPAKGRRGSVIDIYTYKNSNWHGGWLYKILGNLKFYKDNYLNKLEHI